MPNKGHTPAEGDSQPQVQIPGSAKDNVERLRMLHTRWLQRDLASASLTPVRFEPARGGALWDLFVGGEKVSAQPGAPIALLNEAVADLARKLTLRFRSDAAALQLCGFPTEAFDAPGEEAAVGVDPAVEKSQAPFGWVVKAVDGELYEPASGLNSARGVLTGSIVNAARWDRRGIAERRSALLATPARSFEVVPAPRRNYHYPMEGEVAQLPPALPA